MTERQENKNQPQVEKDLPNCGLVMPISASLKRNESYWKDVQKLLHRIIFRAGFEPKNVWEGSATDRISERIIGNLFDLPIVVVDISDLNPNVMFELGLRLASKKPTVVICNNEVSIPFDIRDFEAIFYPCDLNILGIEEFFNKLEKTIKERYAASQKQSYSPFLANVIVDVASPETREVDFSNLVLSRLDDVSRRISVLDARTRQSVTRQPEAPAAYIRGQQCVEIPNEHVLEFKAKTGELWVVDDVEELYQSGEKTTFMLNYSGPNERDAVRAIMRLARSLGGDEGIPF